MWTRLLLGTRSVLLLFLAGIVNGAVLPVIPLSDYETFSDSTLSISTGTYSGPNPEINGNIGNGDGGQGFSSVLRPGERITIGLTSKTFEWQNISPENTLALRHGGNYPGDTSAMDYDIVEFPTGTFTTYYRFPKEFHAVTYENAGGSDVPVYFTVNGESGTGGHFSLAWAISDASLTTDCFVGSPGSDGEHKYIAGTFPSTAEGTACCDQIKAVAYLMLDFYLCSSFGQCSSCDSSQCAFTPSDLGSMTTELACVDESESIPTVAGGYCHAAHQNALSSAEFIPAFPYPMSEYKTAFDDTCVKRANGNGDPHMQGFNGQRFDVVGRANATYNLLADDRLQLSMDTNSAFFDHAAQDTAPDISPPLFMTSVNVAAIDANGVVHEMKIVGDLQSSLHRDSSCDSNDCPLHGLRVEMAGGRGGVVHTEVVVQLSEQFTLTTKNTECELANSDCSHDTRGYGPKKGRAIFTTPFLQLQVGAIFQNNHNVDARVLHHLDFAIEQYSPSGQVGGILGSTLEVRYNQAGEPILSGPDCIEGHETDYLIEGLAPSHLRNNAERGAGNLFRASGDGDSAL